jgi:hypothetical protein
MISDGTRPGWSSGRAASTGSDGAGLTRKELGQLDSDKAAMNAEEEDDGPADVPDEAGRLTQEEKDSVMIDLRPT